MTSLVRHFRYDGPTVVRRFDNHSEVSITVAGLRRVVRLIDVQHMVGSVRSAVRGTVMPLPQCRELSQLTSSVPPAHRDSRRNVGTHPVAAGQFLWWRQPSRDCPNAPAAPAMYQLLIASLVKVCNAAPARRTTTPSGMAILLANCCRRAQYSLILIAAFSALRRIWR